jgi:spermidine synthase
MATTVFAFSLGAAAVVAQLELLREYLALAGGNEVAVGLTLAAWLAAGGLGSLAAHAARKASGVAAAFAFAALALGYGLGLWLVWGGRALLGYAPGEVVGWLRAFGFAFAAVGPAAFCGGAAFALVAAATGEAKKAYIAEAAGSCLAGLLFTTLLYRWVTPPGAGALAFFCAAAAALAAAVRSSRGGRLLSAALAAATATAGVVVLFSHGAIMSRWFFARSFPGEEVLAYRTSPYGAVVVAARADQYSLYENGLLVASYPDRLAAEETVQPAMLLRPEAERVVLFGGGLSGALDEFAKFPAVREVIYVELDAALVEEAAATYAPAIATRPGVRFEAADGRRWARRAAAEGLRADVVLVAMPAPVSAQVNRYYTLGFFEDVKKLLAPGGLAAWSAPGAANYYPPELAEFLSSTRRTGAAAFRDVAYLPGERFTFLASDASFDASAGAYAAALRRAGVANRHLTETYFRYALTPDRKAAAARATALPAPVNTDLKPTALYYGLTLWAARLGEAEKGILSAARGLGLWYIIALAAALAAPWFIWRRRLGGRPAVALALAAQGFVEVALELLIIFGYQVVYGAAYLELALIVGAFMAGLAVGGLLPRPASPRGDRQRLVNVLGYTVLIAFALPPTLYLLSRWAAAPGVVLHAVFGGLAAAAGLCGGAQFVVALRAWGERGAGALYGLDLLGSALGAAVTAVVLVPVLGLSRTAMVVAALAAAGMAALAAAPRGAAD